MQKMASWMLFSDWSSDVCSSDLDVAGAGPLRKPRPVGAASRLPPLDQRADERARQDPRLSRGDRALCRMQEPARRRDHLAGDRTVQQRRHPPLLQGPRSEEHTSELQSLMRISYSVFCLKKKNPIKNQ